MNPMIEDHSNKLDNPNEHDQATNIAIIEDPDPRPLPQDPTHQNPNIQDPP